jgi:hypothetical protein
VRLVHFSGHGSDVPDDDGEEAEGRDDWRRKVFDGLGAGVSLAVIADCCHSGTITRALHLLVVRPDNLTSSPSGFRAALDEMARLPSIRTDIDPSKLL